MDIQLKRGLIEICVLAALLGGESYGWALIKEISEYVEISESTLYPILKRLESASYVTVTSREHNGRLRKYYALTEKGRAELQEFLLSYRELTTAVDKLLTDTGGDPNDKANPTAAG